MKIYLDMCSIQRPLDDKTQLRVLVEAEAILGVIALCESGQTDLVASDALVYETERNPHAVRKRFARKLLAKAVQYVDTTASVEERAREFMKLGIRPLDALHLASAMAADADCFCTCDDQFLRRAKTADTGRTHVVSPLELVKEVKL